MPEGRAGLGLTRRGCRRQLRCREFKASILGRFQAISTLVRGEPRMRRRAGAWCEAGGSWPAGAGGERLPPEVVGGDDLGYRNGVGAQTSGVRGANRGVCVRVLSFTSFFCHFYSLNPTRPLNPPTLPTRRRILAIFYCTRLTGGLPANSHALLKSAVLETASSRGRTSSIKMRG